jgi:hypothetical protein
MWCFFAYAGSDVLPCPSSNDHELLLGMVKFDPIGAIIFSVTKIVSLRIELPILPNRSRDVT